MQTSRRKLLLTGAAAGAGLTTSAFAKAAPPKFDEVYDVFEPLAGTPSDAEGSSSKIS